ncbi:alpha/beta fold hydrolase [Rhodanobacter sp. B05]|uniref:alpha/beta fold hydrolase n=1 Tax=Rhodanobacter sp. B05 TaxID=1945859 RepID=UPI0020C3E17A|nr:alpha/beta fold hydrolase [Rhodanobacter sp. B05]
MDRRRWIVAALLLLFVSVLQAQPVSFADLAKHPEYREVRISPDGKYVAATALLQGGQTVLALVDLATRKPIILRLREGDDVVRFDWVGPERLVYSVGHRIGGYDAPLSTGELFAVNGDGSGANMLYGYRKTAVNADSGSLIPHATTERGTASLIAAIPDDPQHILVSVSLWDTTGYELNLPVAYRMDVRSGDKIKMLTAPMRGAEFLADHQGRIRFAYGEANDGSWKVYEHPLKGDGWTLLPEFSNNRSTPLAFSSDDRTVYFECPAGAAGFGVCSWDVATRKLATVWSNQRVEEDDLAQGLARDSIIGVSFTDGRPGLSVFDSQSADAQALIMLMKQFPGEQVSFTSGTTDGGLSLVLVQADADPGAFYLFDPKAHKLTMLLPRMPWIDPSQMARKQPIEFAARDGLKLQGYVTYPPGEESAKQLPMVVVVHGGPYGIRDRWDYDPDVQALATRGYAVLQVNFRGSGGYGYDFVKAGWRQWGGTMQDDVTDGTRWAIAQGIADPKRICIYGVSYGGYAALEGAMKEPDLYQCTIGYVGIYDLPLMFHRGDTHDSSWGEDFLKRALGNDMAVLASHSPINQLDSLKAKVMLVVGGKDYRVPEIQGLHLHQALLDRHIAHEWMLKPDEMHGFYNEANVTELYTRMLQFIGASIGPGMTGKAAAAGAAAH